MVDYSRWNDLVDSDDDNNAETLAEASKRANLERKLNDFNRRYMDFGMRRQNNDACRLRYRLKLAEKKTNPMYWYEQLLKLDAELPELNEEYARLITERDRLQSHSLLKGQNRVGFAKTSINKEQKPKFLASDAKYALSEQELCMQNFVEQWKPLAHNYANLESNEQSMRFLMRYPSFIGRDAIAYLMNLSVRMIIAGQMERIERLLHQIIILYFINEQAERNNEDPRCCIFAFFCRIKEPNSAYYTAFLRETRTLKKHLKARITAGTLQPLPQGPAGLDPYEVYEDLPPMLQFCFKHRDAKQLVESFYKLPANEAKFHLERCIGSGLWVLPKPGMKPSSCT